MHGSRFFVLIGASGLINTSNTRTIIYSNKIKEKNTILDNSTENRRFNFSGKFIFGVDYLNTENTSLFVLPYVQYGFLGLSKTASINRYFLSVGLSMGLRL